MGDNVRTCKAVGCDNPATRTVMFDSYESFNYCSYHVDNFYVRFEEFDVLSITPYKAPPSVDVPIIIQREGSGLIGVSVVKKSLTALGDPEWVVELTGNYNGVQQTVLVSKSANAVRQALAVLDTKLFVIDDDDDDDEDEEDDEYCCDECGREFD